MSRCRRFGAKLTCSPLRCKQHLAELRCFFIVFYCNFYYYNCGGDFLQWQRCCKIRC